MAGAYGRNNGSSDIQTLSKAISYADGASNVYTVGRLPAGALVLRAGIAVTTAFNAGTGNIADLGTSGDDDGFATDLALGTIGNIVADEMATTNDQYSTSETSFTCTLALTGTAATAGAGFAWCEFIVPAN